MTRAVFWSAPLGGLQVVSSENKAFECIKKITPENLNTRPSTGRRDGQSKSALRHRHQADPHLPGGHRGPLAQHDWDPGWRPSAVCGGPHLRGYIEEQEATRVADDASRPGAGKGAADVAENCPHTGGELATGSNSGH